MNTLPFSSPNNTALSDVLGIDSPQTAIFKAQTQILEILEIGIESGVEVEKIFLTIQDLVEKLHSEIGYDYQDYEERLLMSEDTLRACIDKTPLPGLIQKIKKKIPDPKTRDIIKDRLGKQLLEDLAYESFQPDTNKNKKLDLSNHFFDKYSVGNHTEFLEQIQGCTALNLSNNELEYFDETILRLIFENIHSINRIDLSLNYLNKLDEKSFEIVFHHLQHIQSIDLSHTSWGGEIFLRGLRMMFSYIQDAKIVHLNGWHLENYSQEYLKMSFEYLQHIRHLSLRSCHIHTLSPEQLNSIFSQLSMLKSLDLSDNNFSHFDESTLQIIFGCLPNLRSLGLAMSYFDTMSISQLESIFSSLHCLRKIDLSDTDFALLDDGKIQCILGNLKSLQSINLSQCRLQILNDQKIEFLFRFLTQVKKITVSETDKWVIDLITKFPELHGKIIISQ